VSCGAARSTYAAWEPASPPARAPEEPRSAAAPTRLLGLCGPGEATDFVRAGNFAFDSPVPCNTSGTEHSWSYLQGFTHISEAVRQLRGEGGPTQVEGAETSLVTGMGSTDAGLSQALALLATA
jgi:hypothetical protein